MITPQKNIRVSLSSISVFTALVLMWSSLAISAEDYSAGMRAYMANDYSTAQIHWLNGAKSNDAKSMFNLGLLHQQKKLVNASPEKAEVWFDLAGKHGYASADYHLAKLNAAENADSDDVRALMLRAADNGSVPAQRWLQSVNKSPNDLVSETSNSTATNNTANISVNEDTNRDQQAQIASRRNQQQSLINKNALAATSSESYLREDWIATKQSSDWTIQMLAFSDKAKVQQFIDQHKLHKLASYFAESGADGVLYKLIYGSYGSKQEAAQARDNLSAELKEYGPWLRSMASVQSLLGIK